MSSPLQNNITNLQNLLEQVNSLPEAGTDLPELTNQATPEELFLNKELIDADGNKVTGTFTIDTELSAQNNLISQIQTALQNKASASEPMLQSKAVTPTTSVQNVTSDSGYDGLSKVTVNAIPSTYVQPTATKSATTYTPTTSNQTIAAGTYCSGVQTIRGDANLKAENIAEGVSIFGVTGTLASGGGSNSGNIDTCELRVVGAGPCNVVYMTSDNSGGVCTDVSLSSAVHNNLTAVCGSYVSIIGNTMNATMGDIHTNGTELVLQKNWGAIFKITAAVGESASIQIIMV
jgi:hypothetical protein